MRWWSAIVALVVASSVSSRAQASPWHVDVGGTALVEAWDLNESGEALAGVVVGGDRRIWRGLAIRSEGHLTHVEQEGPDAWLHGITIGARGRWERTFGRPFVDLAFGWANASHETPPRGTTSNYLIVSGGGIELPAGAVSLELGARWFHVSNNGREGAHHNPDIQSLGIVVAIGWRPGSR
jgi:Lipid A 3-O-deacylase (PagL).